MNIAQAATGKKRYGLGERNAPTRGQVNPQGYIKRELAKPNKPSQTRSGLAQTALKNIRRFSGGNDRMQPPKTGSMNYPGKGVSTQPVIKSRPQTHNSPFGIHNPFGMFNGGGKNQPSKPHTKPGSTDLPVGSTDVAVQQPPTVRVDQNGQLDLPFDEAFSMDMLQQQQGADRELLDLQQQEQAQQMDYQRSLRDVGLQYEDAKRSTLNDNAARGMAFSSGYGVGASRNATNYNNFLNDLNADNAMAQSQFGQQRAFIQNALADYIRQATLSQVMGMAPEAGDLGYGVDAPEVAIPKPSSPIKKSSPPKKSNKPKHHPKPKQSPAIKKLAGARAESGKGSSNRKSQPVVKRKK